ncbi:alpha-L-fucosidase [Niabella hirudinis]|uniref:alpha-L-fucosidase n=1 Tax=Niabella hirudinis TaxID=1285929 RepID=UPI003EBC4C16
MLTDEPGFIQRPNINMKKINLFWLVMLFVCHCANAQTPANMQWWQNGKFGLFLHWGLYSIGHSNGKPQKSNEHFMLGERIPLATYARLSDSLTLNNYDPDAWVKMARDAGMTYIVITAKHHEGFAMFDSPSSDYNIVKMSPAHIDPMKGLAAACKKYGLKLCFYYSLGRDWADPDVPTDWPVKAGRSNTWDYPDEDKKDLSKYFERKVKPQVRELLTQYGPVGIIWFDTPEKISRAQSQELYTMIKKLQPGCIVNSRIGNGLGDYSVSEQKIENKTVHKPWESCITMSGKWGYSKFDTAWKSPELLVRQLVEIVCKGGNLLLNVGPTASGSFPAPAKERLQAIGRWMHINNEAIYGVKPWMILNENAIELKDTHGDVMGKSDNDFTSKQVAPDIYFSQKGMYVYIYARSWKQSRLLIKSMPEEKIQIKSITLLGSKKAVKWQQQKEGLAITMPAQLPAIAPVYVFKVQRQ